MNRRSRIFRSVFFALWPMLVIAQEPVYESKGQAGPVFSDVPAAGAKPLYLAPINVMDAPPAPAPAPPPARQEDAAAPTPYSRLAIITPENEGTIHTNTGDFDLQLQIEPPLAADHTILVTLDGKPLAHGYDRPQIQINATDWASAGNPDSIEHSLQVAIADRTGAVLLESEPIRFYVHHAVGRAHAR